MEIVNFEVAVPPGETIRGFVPKLVIGPDGETEAERLIVPPKLLMLDTVTVLFEFEPWSIVRLDGFAETAKSGFGF